MLGHLQRPPPLRLPRQRHQHRAGNLLRQLPEVCLRRRRRRQHASEELRRQQLPECARVRPERRLLLNDDDDELMLNVLRCHLTY